MWWIVNQGKVRELDIAALPTRETYGTDWLFAEAADAAEALAIAERYDAGEHAELGFASFASAYRSGLVGAPDGDRLVNRDGAADALGTTAGTLDSWRRRHADFPQPVDGIGPVWWLSDVMTWHARPRRTGRPAR